MADPDTSASGHHPPRAPRSGEGAARPAPIGLYDRPKGSSITEIEIIAGALSAVWLLGTAIYFTFIAAEVPEGASDGGLRGLLILLVVIMPVAMIWVGATAARAVDGAAVAVILEGVALALALLHEARDMVLLLVALRGRQLGPL